MVTSTSMRITNLILILFVAFVFITITVPGTISGAPTAYKRSGGRTENGPSYQVWDRDKPSRSSVHIPSKDEIENAVRGTAKKIYDRYFGNLTNSGEDAECLLGSAQIYLWWIDDEGHIRPQLGYKEEALCDWSNSNLSEYNIRSREEVTQIKVIY